MHILGRIRPSLASASLLLGAFGASMALAEPASAAPTKVACVGEQTTHSDQLQRPVEYPAMLQTKLGAGYDVQNFGDCCSTVMFGYPRQGETHPYLSGQMGISPLDANGMPVMPGYQLGVNPSYMQSIPYGPDIVVVGSWGKHDTEIANALYAGQLDRTQWQAQYERLVTTYLNLPSKPTVYVSTPLPIPKGQPIGVTTTVILPSIEAVAAKYQLKIVPLYQAFLNQPQLYKDDTHPTNTQGLQTIADTVYAAMTGTQPPSGDGGSDDGGSQIEAGGNPMDDASAGTGAGGSGSSSGGAGAPSVGADASGSSSNDAGPPGGGGCAVATHAAGGAGGGALAALMSCAATLLLGSRRRAAQRRRS